MAVQTFKVTVAERFDQSNSCRAIVWQIHRLTRRACYAKRKSAGKKGRPE
jgi:hypothetical protein